MTHHYQGEDGPLGEDMVLVLDPESGAVVRSWGAGRFLLPHGVTVDQRGNTWLTDVGLHQVFKVRGATEDDWASEGTGACKAQIARWQLVQYPKF